MAFLLLNLRAASTPARRPEGRGAPLRLSFPHVTLSNFPRRSLLGSSFLHGMAILGILFAPPFIAAPRHPLEQEDPLTSDPIEAKQVLYLPQLGGGAEGRGHPAGGAAASGKGKSVAPATATPGFTYPGPQRIISNVPNATNSIQTILQPELKNPPKLVPLVPAPNLLELANADPPSLFTPAQTPPPKPAFPFKVKPLSPAQPKARTNNPSVPVIQPSLQDPTNPAGLVVPANPPPPLNEESNPDPEAPATPQLHRYDRISTVPTRGTDTHTRLSISPTPAAPDVTAHLPAGEARGRFMIGPEPSPPNENGDPGSNLNGHQPSSTLAVGSPNGSLQGNSLEEGGGGVGNGTPGGDGRGRGIGAGEGAGSGKGGGGTLNDSGRGNGKGSGVGSGSGTGSGSGSGGGSGPGAGVFSGMTIQGGSLGSGLAGRPAPHGSSISVPPQGAYGMTIVATASSGGGLRDFGVFSHEQVYTVYIDMRKTLVDPALSWILQCSVLRGAEKQSQSPDSGEQGFAPPFPMVREPLNLPPERVQKLLHRMMVVYAVVDTDGKVGQAAVKQSPDPELNKCVLEALSKWTFRPAHLNGTAVPVKILLGIPLALNQ